MIQRLLNSIEWRTTKGGSSKRRGNGRVGRADELTCAAPRRALESIQTLEAQWEEDSVNATS